MSVEELKALQLKIIEKNKKFNKVSTIIILIIIISTLIFLLLKSWEFHYIIFVLLGELFFSIFLVFIFKMFLNNDDINLFNKNFKKVFVEKALNDSFDDVIYVPEKGFSANYIHQVGMLNTSDSFYSNDFVSASYKGINFEQSDIFIQEERESRNSDGERTTEYITLFRGRLMIFDFNKVFKANIQVASKYFGARALPWNQGYKNIQMDDIEFNNIFNVYAQNEYETFYVLTPYFMSKLKEIKKRLNCEVMFAFVDNRLHVAINDYSDSFECNVYKVINEEEINANILKEINVIIDFVNELNLENDLFENNDLHK